MTGRAPRTPADLEARTRQAYDAVAGAYARLLADDLAGAPWDRAVLAAFAEAMPPGPVLDAGCGPGRITAHLAGLGLDARGLDLSPRMVAIARRTHPSLRFVVGSLTDLPEPDAGLAGALAWYSLIHLDRAGRADALADLHRVLAPGGLLLTAFQVGTDHLRRTSAYGHPVRLDVWRLDPADLTDQLRAAGFELVDRWDRPPSRRETTPQTALLARAAPRRAEPAPEGDSRCP
ncbi:Methyltransferase domain-containing protein [Klenkia soli]|uniref:Methyltransferase domain-containing protein n=1 Tax=Klenkia soli TaxID=1052260 RepID=A0A1H0MB65_9ACTN|nr:class I SAM-dependent methyltransferase [Klenkia soli]SDO77565.1 Methyltransferase domain-containing protein [Klenkia soli]